MPTVGCISSELLLCSEPWDPLRLLPALRGVRLSFFSRAGGRNRDNSSGWRIPKCVHTSVTAWKTFFEKSMVVSTNCKSGVCRCTFLCFGVNCSFESAWTPQTSSVTRDRRSHVFLWGHHNAWSDQSLATPKRSQNAAEFLKFASEILFSLNPGNTLFQYVFIHFIYEIILHKPHLNLIYTH